MIQVFLEFLDAANFPPMLTTRCVGAVRHDIDT